MKRAAMTRLAILALPALLAGCGDSGIAEVRQWMEQVRRDTKVSVPKLPTPKEFQPFAYEGKATIDPFSNAKLAAGLAKASAASGNSLKPDLNRRREALEAFPLDGLKMVGTLERGGAVQALVQADKVIYQVKVGNYIGQNMGKVIGITEAAVDIREVVQDASGEWVERRAKLELQENRK